MHDDENKEQTCKTVILILENRRFKIDRQRLMQKSHYFAALLSPNYKEHRQLEHVINYEIPLKIFKVSFILFIQKESLLDRKIYVTTCFASFFCF